MSEATEETNEKVLGIIVLVIIACIYFGILSIQESEGYTNDNFYSCKVVKNVNRLNPISRGLGEYICSGKTGDCTKLYYDNGQCIEARTYNKN